MKSIPKKLHTLEDLEMLLDNIDMGVFIKDKNGRYIYGNEVCAKLAGIDKCDFIGTYDRQYFADEYNDEHLSSNVIHKPKLFEELIEVDGEEKWFETYKGPIYDENNELKNIIAITKDINVEKRLREEIYQNYSILNDIKNYTDHTTNIRETLYSIAQDINKRVGSDGLSINLYNKEHKALEIIVKLGYAAIASKDIDYIPIEDVSVLKVLEDKKRKGVKSKAELIEIDYNASKRLGDAQYLGTYPIKLGNEYLGCLNISYTDYNIPKYDQDDFLEVMCNQIAILVKNHRLTEELRIENQKRTETEKELELYLNTAADLLGTIGADGYFKTLNYNWSKVLGWSEEELLSTKIMQLVHPDDIDEVYKRIKNRTTDSEAKRMVLRVRCKDGSYSYLDWSVKYIEDKDTLIVAVRDITAQREYENEKLKLEEAIKIESIKNEFFANVSHEFKTPLNIILGTMQLIRKNIQQENITNETLGKHTKIIKQNSYRLLRLVNNLIDISRIDTGFFELNRSNQNIVKIIEDITLSIADYVEERKIELIFDTDEEEVITSCDPDKIERVVLNILSNAIKYTPKGGKIEVTINNNEENIIVHIKDSGIGIPKEKLDVIFDRYGQVNSELSRNHEGSGIGLSLVKSIINLHGGKIKVNSKVGSGSEFIFELPIIELKEEVVQVRQDNRDYTIEKCNIEFADIYS